MIEWLRNPQHRVRAAWFMLWWSLVCWPATHLLMVLLRPPESSWVFHVLLAISWLAITLTALNIVVTTDVRQEQES